MSATGKYALQQLERAYAAAARHDWQQAKDCILRARDGMLSAMDELDDRNQLLDSLLGRTFIDTDVRPSGN